jgi:hypothetical protein
LATHEPIDRGGTRAGFGDAYERLPILLSGWRERGQTQLASPAPNSDRFQQCNSPGSVESTTTSGRRSVLPVRSDITRRRATSYMA